MFYKKCIVIFVFLILTGSTVFGFDFYYTSNSIDMMMFYQEEITEHIKLLNNGDNAFLYISAYDNAISDYDGHLANVFNMTITKFFRINDYFFIPLNVSLNVLNGYYGDWKEDGFYSLSYMRIFPNSGFVFQHRY